jgi:hypothetical protein
MRFSSLIGTAVISFLSLIAAAPADLRAQGTLIPVTTRRDMVFDHAGKYLYISTSDEIQRYNLFTGQLESPYILGGSLRGLDISADDSFLLVAQENTDGVQGTFHKLDLATGMVTNIHYVLDTWEAGAWDVAIAANNLAFVTTQFAGSGWTPLRQIDLTTNAVSIRSDVPFIGGVRQNTHIQRSADRTRLYFLESNDSAGPVFTYSATTNTFTPEIYVEAFLDAARAAVNRNGTLLGTQLYNGLWLNTAPNHILMHNFGEIDQGVAFNAVRDIVYGGTSSTDEIIGYDTGTFAEVFRARVGEWDFSTLVASQDGRYLAMMTASGIRLLPAVIAGTGNLANISTRLTVQTGENVLIGGFIIAGSGPKQVVIRAIGPSLGIAGVPNPLQDPVLELHGGPNNEIIASNDDWQSAPNAADIPPALRPSDTHESAILMTLQPGSYTAIVSGSSSTSGTGLVEVYDVDGTTRARLANVSTRGFVQSGDDVMIGGIIAQGGDGISQVVVRAIGPSLAALGISNVLANPTLELRDGNGAMIRSNDDWKTSQQAALEAIGLAPSNDLESAILATLTAGNYTAVVSDRYASDIGVGLVEIYDLD